MSGGRPCETGYLQLSTTAGDDRPGGELANFVAAERTAGAVLIGRVPEGLVCNCSSSTEVVSSMSEGTACERAIFNERAVFTFVKAEANTTVDFQRAFQRNDTTLQIATGRSDYTFVAGVSTLIINSVCLYTEFSSGEVDAQRTEACFPGDAAVSMSATGQKEMRHLRTGDEVMTKVSGGRSRVIGWTHHVNNILFEFIQLRVAAGRRLTLSLRHYVYVNGLLKPARKVRVGDRLSMVRMGNSTVVGIERVWRQGLFNAQTQDGDIIVDGFVCSTYTEALQPFLAHSLLMPFRLFSMFGVDGLRISRMFDDDDVVLPR